MGCYNNKGGKKLSKLNSITNSIMELLKNSPKKMILTGDYYINKERYKKLNIDKDILINKLKVFSAFSDNAMKNNVYILHLGI
ncbi:hypothetical protein AGMMS49579_02690 [Spirochaetia bacterium]|nr:hypothetical protein AGMMS49579_02690 [Spirochaetia bacterium]